jgi:predicted nucleotidyltransferase/HEPN domain-containing protein
MKTTLDHLPPHQREQLRAISDLVRAEAPVDKVILFGSYARGDAVEDFENGYVSDFDVLVVVGTPAEAADAVLWQGIRAKASALAAPIPVSLFVHDIKQINQEIRKRRYFYSDVLREGVMLHDARRFMLARPRVLKPPERLEVARRDFRYWFESASVFWRLAGLCTTFGQFAHAAFLLHQATERYFHAVLLVFTGYKPKTHDIRELAEETAPLHERLAGAMPRVAPDDAYLFDLLQRAYIDARYSKSYTITEAELTALRVHVRDLALRVHDACAACLASILGAEAVGPLPAVPDPNDMGEPASMPPLDDARAVERWLRAVVAIAAGRGRREGLEQGELRGREEGLREGLRQGRREGREEGLEEGQRALLLRQLERRFGPLPAHVTERVAQASAPDLERWADRVLDAPGLDAVFSSR